LQQPSHVGFSYDIPVNGTLPLLDPNAQFRIKTVAPPWEEQKRADQIFLQEFTLDAYYEAVGNLLLLNGTFPSGNSKLTANTTGVAAAAVWHFLQGWLKSFPQYDPKDAGVNLFAESYGGKYGYGFGIL
jgi:hypothetical protein